jgi:hypothetical protein
MNATIRLSSLETCSSELDMSVSRDESDLPSSVLSQVWVAFQRVGTDPVKFWSSNLRVCQATNRLAW